MESNIFCHSKDIAHNQNKMLYSVFNCRHFLVCENYYFIVTDTIHMWANVFHVHAKECVCVVVDDDDDEKYCDIEHQQITLCVFIEQRIILIIMPMGMSWHQRPYQFEVHVHYIHLPPTESHLLFFFSVDEYERANERTN